MDNLDLDKYIGKINGNVKEEKGSYLKKIGIKILLTTIIFFVGAILVKSNASYKEIIYDNIYNKNISFTSIKNFYNNYLGSIIPIEKLVTNVEPVFSSDLKYISESKYHDGVKLELENNYLVPILESGLVVYSGEKENYGNVIIVEGIDGIDIWYGNIANTSYKLYDYVEKGQLLGEVNDNYLYLVYAQNGKYLNYEDYFK